MDTSFQVRRMLHLVKCLLISHPPPPHPPQKKSVPGSIVANKSFIAQFGTERNAKGALVLDPRYVGGFTAVQSIGQIIGMLSGGWVRSRLLG